MQQPSSLLAGIDRPGAQLLDRLRKTYGGRPQVPLHEAFGSPAEAADAYCTNALQRKILQVLAGPKSSGAQAKGLSLPDIAHRVALEEEAVLRCLVAEYSQWGLFTAVKFKGPGRRAFALAPFADFESYPPGMQPCTLWHLACQCLKKAGHQGLKLEDLRDGVVARGFQGFESLPDEMCDVMLQGVLSGNVAGGSILVLPNGNVVLASTIKEGQVFESAEATPEASTVANGNGIAVSSPVSPTPAAGGPFLDAKEKVSEVAPPAFAAASDGTPRRGTLPVAAVSPEVATKAPNLGLEAGLLGPSKLRHVDVPVRAPPGPAPVNAVEMFGPSMLRKRTTSVETGSVASVDSPEHDGITSGGASILDSGTSSVGDVHAPDSATKTPVRARSYQGPSIPAGPELDFGPGILKKRDRAVAPLPAAPPPLSPAILKHRTWSPRHTSDSSEVALSPVSAKHSVPGLDPVTPPNQELLSVQISPPAQQGGPGEVSPAVKALVASQPGIPMNRAETLVRDMIEAPALTRRLRTKMALEGLMSEEVELQGGLETAIQDALAAFSLASKA